MKRRKKVFLIIIAIPVICFLLYFLLILGPFFYVLLYEKRQMPTRITQLIYQTDHHALLEACRNVSKEASEGRWKTGHLGYSIRKNPDPNASRFPKIILDLNPGAVIILDDGRVIIEMVGGIIHYGIVAYPVDFMKHHKNYEYEDKKLIDGLWYYDDGYHEYPNYENYIQSLKPK